MPFEGVNAIDVVCVYDTCANEAAEELGNEVDGEAAEGKFAEDAIRQCDGRTSSFRQHHGSDLKVDSDRTLGTLRYHQRCRSQA